MATIMESLGGSNGQTIMEVLGGKGGQTIAEVINESGLEPVGKFVVEYNANGGEGSGWAKTDSAQSATVVSPFTPDRNTILYAVWADAEAEPGE